MVGHEFLEPGMKLAQCIASRIYRRMNFPNALEFGDALQFGYVGLLEAMNKNGCENEKIFLGYAKKRIEGAIIDGIWGKRSKRNLLRKMTALEIPLSDLDPNHQALMIQPRQMVGINKREVKHLLNNIIAVALSDREKAIIIGYFYHNKKSEELAELLSITTNGVYQIKYSALNKIKKSLKKRGLTKQGDFA